MSHLSIGCVCVVSVLLTVGCQTDKTQTDRATIERPQTDKASLPIEAQLAKVTPPKYVVTGKADVVEDTATKTTRITTDEWAAVKGIRTLPMLARVPGSWAQRETFHYEYAFLLDKGVVTIQPNGTLVLEAGQVYIASTRVRDDATLYAPLIIQLYPLIARGAISAGSTSTEWIFAVPPSGPADRVEIAFRSSNAPGASVWTSNGLDTQLNGESELRMVRHRAMAVTLTPGSRLPWGSPLSADQKKRFDALEAAAHKAGVHD